MKEKYKLIGSAASVNELRSLVEMRWGWSGVTFDLFTKDVFANGRRIDGVRIVGKAGRFRLERKID